MATFTPSKYRIERADRANRANVHIGEIVYHCARPDYGLARDDTDATDATGVTHISVSRDPAGGYPLFTIPQIDLARIAE